MIDKIIELEKDWDVIPTIGDKDVKDLIIKNNGIKALEEFIFRKNTGSFLLSGQRGSGKTTSAINILNKVNKDECMIIYLDAIYIEAVSGKNNDYSNNMLQILRQLIRTLKRELIKNDYEISAKIEELCDDLNSTEIEWVNRSLLSITKNANYGLGGSFSGDINQHPLKVKVSTEAKIKHSKKEKNENLKLNKTVGFSIEGLADNFSQFIKDIESGKLKRNKIKKEIFGKKIPFIKVKNNKVKIKKVIFVFDELDVYDEKSKDILETLKKFKNLFSLSKAQFVFIVGETTYSEVLNNDKFKTLFTEKYFLSKPQGDDMEKFLDDVIKNKKQIEENIIWKQLKWFIISSSEHNFYQFIQQIRSYTVYDFDNKKLNINIKELLPQEKIQASIHYALNEIYKKHINDRSHSHYDNILFNELISIENNFLDWLHNKTDINIKLTLYTDSSVSRAEDISKIRNAKIAYLKYLYLLSNITPPDGFCENTDEIKIDWQALSIGLIDFEKIMKGIVGPVTVDENNLLKTTEKVKTKIKDYLNFYQIDTKSKTELSELVKDISELFGFNYSEENMVSIDETVKQIKDDFFYNRNLEKTKSVLELINNFDELINNFEYSEQNKYILKKDWGDVKTDETINEIILGSDSSHGNRLLSRTTIYIPQKIDNKNFEITYKVKIKDESLINFLINTKYTGSEIEDEFYMVRVDNRKETTMYSILFKPESDLKWNFITNNPLGVISKIKKNEWISIKIIISNNKITLFKNKRNKFIEIVSFNDLTQSIKSFGFANELEKESEIVEIKDLSIKSL